MPIHAGTGFIDILPRVSTAAFQGAMNAQLKPAVSSFTSGLKSAFAPLAPIIAGTAAVAIGKMTLDFENAFTRISAISNATAAQINRWRDAVFELGQETAIAPARLADGLFFLASAGLDANQIFPALTASAKAAAIGLGEMEDLTRTVAQVLNAFPDSGLKAIDVIDTLTAAVRESTAEPEEFATALGRVLPIAAKAGVEIDDLVASLATLSNIGLDVDEGVTGIRQVLNLIVSPGKQAAETMNDLGISTEELRKRLADKGIINTLRFLNEKVGESEDKFRKLLPNIRAMTAAFGLTEQEASKVDGIFERVANSTGDLGKALAETQAGPGFKFRAGIVALQEAAIRLGQAFLPIGTLIIGVFTSILGPIADVLALLGKIPGIVTAVFTAFVSLKIIQVLTGWTTALTAAVFGNTAAIAAETLALEAEALAAEEAAAAATFLARAQGQVTLSMGASAVATETAAVASEGAAAGTAGLGAGLGALLSPVGLAVAGIGLLAYGLHDAHQAAQELDAGVESLARRLATGELNERGIRELFANQDVPDFAQAKFDAIARRIIIRANEITLAQRKAREEIVQTSDAIVHNMVPAFDQGANILRSMGTNATAFSQAAVTALRTSDEAFNKFEQGALKDAAKLISDFRTKATDNLNFTADALVNLSTEASQAQQQLAETDFSTIGAADLANLRAAADLTAGELLKSFKDARKETKEFGKDLLIISKTGGEAGQRVAEVLLNAGENGKAAAETIAEAGPKMRDALVRNFAAGEGAAESLATKLTRKIVGTLESIRDLLEDIAHTFNIGVDLQGDEAVGRSLQTIQGRLNEIDGYTAVAHITTVQTREGGPLPPGIQPKDTGATGGVVGAQHGGITRRPTLLVGEGRGYTPYGKGAEAILPLDDHTVGRLGASIAHQIELPTVIVKVGEAELARTVTRAQRRHGSLAGVR